MQTVNQYKIDRFDIFPLEYSVVESEGKKVSLQPKFMEVLVHLIEQYPRIVPRQELIDVVWKGNNYVGEKALTNAIWHLRKNLQPQSTDRIIIETIRKTGYRLLVEPQIIGTEQPIKTSTRPEPVELPKQWLNANKIIFISILLLIILATPSFWSAFHDHPNISPQITTITTEPGRELFVAPSPNGRFVVYKWISPDGRIDLFMRDMKAAGQPARALTMDNAVEGHSVWSNDGLYLYYSRKKTIEGSCEIIRLNVKTNEDRKIIDCPLDGGYYYIDISPDGRTLAYHGGHHEKADNGIYFIDLIKEQASPVRFSCLENCDYRERDFAFSPDGKSIVVTRRFNRFNEDIYLIDLKTRETKRLTKGESDIVGVTWHPNGKQLVYGVQRSDNRQGYLLDLETGKVERLNIEGFSFPAFAKKEGTLYYQQRQEKYQIASLNIHQEVASSPFPILVSDFNHKFPNYSPTTNQIVYVSNESGNYELWIADPDGNNRQQLTQLEMTVRYPRWSHDGSKVVFLAPIAEEVGDKLYIVDVKTKQLSVLKTKYRNHNQPSWSKDDKKVISAIYDGDYSDLYAIEIATGNAKRITFDGGRFGLMQDNETLFYTRVKSGLWKRSLNDDEPKPSSKILSKKDFSTRYSWTLAKEGVYFQDDKKIHQQINFYSFDTKSITPLVRLPRRTFDIYGGLTLDDSKASLLFTSSDLPQADIKMLSHPLLGNSQ